MTQRIATCQFCGATGTEDPDDIMPNCCPTCFESRIEPVFEGATDMQDLLRRMEQVGCRREIAVRIAQELFS